MSFEETLAIADAMAVRNGKLVAAASYIAASLQGVTLPEKTSKEMREEHMVRQIMLIPRVEQPDKIFKIEEMLDDSQYEKAISKYAEMFGEDIDVGRIKEVSQAFVGTLKSSIGNIDEMAAKEFAATLSAARDVAAEHNVTVADVYLTDELYFDASRRAVSLEKTAQQICKMTEAYSEEMFIQLMVTQFQNMMPQEMIDNITPEELNEFVMEMQLDPSMQAMLKQQVEVAKEAVRQFGVYMLSITYGDNALDRLPIEQQDILTPRMSRVPDYVDFTS